MPGLGVLLVGPSLAIECPDGLATTVRMRVVLIAAQSLDGRITRQDQPGSDFVSPEDRRWFSSCLAEFEGLVMGRATYDSARAAVRAGLLRMPARRRLVMTRQPQAYVSDEVHGQLEFTAAAPAEVLTRLQAAGCRACALLGGGKINRLFLAAGLVQEIWVTIEPRIFGAGRPLVAGGGEISLELTEVTKLGTSVVLLKYAVLGRGSETARDR